MARTKKATEKAPKLTGIKGFGPDLTCRGFQYEIGKTYKHEGQVKACSGGFHAIVADAHPLSVFDYYPPTSRFCRVTLGGVTDTDDKVKVAAEILTVGQEVGLRDLTLEAVKWVMDRAKPEGPTAVKPNGLATASGTRGAATASGYQGAAFAPGKDGRVRGVVGATLHADERGDWDGRGYPAISTASGIVGQNGLKPNTWYVCKAGKLVEGS